VLPIGVLLKAAAVGFGAEDMPAVGDPIREAVGADRAGAPIPDLALLSLPGAGAEHPHSDRGIAHHRSLGLLLGRDLQGVLIDSQAVADPWVRAFPLQRSAGLLTRLTSRITLAGRALVVVLGVLAGGLLALPRAGAALTMAGQTPHLLKLTFGPRGAVTSGLGILDGPLGAPVGLLG